MKFPKVDRAYADLIVEIDEGAEFPDAMHRVAVKHNLNDSQIEDVEHRYDTHPFGRLDPTRKQR